MCNKVPVRAHTLAYHTRQVKASLGSKVGPMQTENWSWMAIGAEESVPQRRILGRVLFVGGAGEVAGGEKSSRGK